MLPVSGWDSLWSDARIAGASVFAVAILLLALGIASLGRYASPAWRRFLNISSLAVYAHGTWWIPHLCIAAPMSRPVAPLLTVLSQMSAILLIDLGVRLDAAARHQKLADYRRYPGHILGTAGLVCALVLGHLSLAAPGRTIFDPAAIALVVLVPLIMAVVIAYPRRKRRTLKVILLALAVAVSTFTVLSGTSRLFEPAQVDRLTVQPLVAVALAALTTLGLSAILLGVSIWKSQLKFSANLRRAIEALPVGLALYDAEDRLLVWNEALSNLGASGSPRLKVGMTYRDALKAGLKSALFPEGANQDPTWLDERAAAHRPGDWIIQSRDGTRWVRLQNRRIEDRGLVAIASDFTDQKRHEAELAEALEQARSANVAKSRFLATMSHEIRTPLNGIIAVTDALSRTELGPKQAEMAALIRSSSETLQILLSDILDLARIEAGQMKLSNAPFDLVRLIDETQSLYANAANEKGVQFHCHIAPEARTWVMGDAVRTRQILNNLLSNAVKFTSEGQISLNVSRSDGNIFIRVDDTGIGFEPRQLSYLFGRFAQADEQITRRYGGSGLGLSICAELADMMGGSVKGNSQPGLGSSFTVSLPLERITPPNPDPMLDRPRLSTDAPKPASDRLRVLLADDNATNRRVVHLILDARQFDIVEVEDGQQALDIAFESPFDLILMDMQMPVMDGLTATRLIREREMAEGRPRIALIMLTANAMPEHVTASLEAGADAHLAKPFNVSQILELAYQLTHRNQPA